MDVLGIFSAFGLSASAGLNAYIPLLVVSLLARFTDLIELDAPWDTLSSWWIIGLLLLLTLYFLPIFLWHNHEQVALLLLTAASGHKDAQIFQFLIHFQCDEYVCLRQAVKYLAIEQRR